MVIAHITIRLINKILLVPLTGFPKLELSSDLISMKILYADPESSPNYNTQVPSGGGSYGYGHGRFPRSFPRRDTDAWRDRPRGPPPSSCQDRSIMVPFYYDSS
jgi:hypothetical protein